MIFPLSPLTIGEEILCQRVGDLPIVTRDDRGREIKLIGLVRGVRYSLNFSDTLISVDQLGHTSRIDTTFRDVCCLTFTANTTSDSRPLRVPFRRSKG